MFGKLTSLLAKSFPSLQRPEKWLLLYAACCFHGALHTAATSDLVSQHDMSSQQVSINPAKANFDANLQIDGEQPPKRGWNSNLKAWGKRGWNNLHSGWGKRGDPNYPAVYEDDYINNGFPIPLGSKRAWQKLQGGWGKRFVPTEDDLALRQIQAALEESERGVADDNDVTDDRDDLELFVPVESDLDEHHYDKRNWNKFTDGWGKRSEQNKWNKFRGSWGKREPAWNNLKGLWGKRSILK